MHAFGGTTTDNSANAGAAGTIYQQTGTQAAGTGTLIIDNNGNASRETVLSGVGKVAFGICDGRFVYRQTVYAPFLHGISPKCLGWNSF